MEAYLLSLARIESRGLQTRERVDMRQVARESVDAHLVMGSIELIGGSELATVRGDRRWLARAVDNMVDNALTHGEAGEPVRVLVQASGANVLVCVQNKGRFAPHVRKRLFRRFVTTRADHGGTGLGLAIVRAVAEAHGGKVLAKEGDASQVEFRLELPAE